MWRMETADLDDGVRNAAEGQFAALKYGYTHFEVGSHAQGQPVVLIHGFSVPYFIWEPTFQALENEGLRPIRYDLYGRGFSDRPRVRYGIDLFVEQLRELLDFIGVEAAALVAISMGGPIAAAFAAAFPRRVKQLVLIDPSGTQPISLGALYRLAKLPVLSDMIFGILGTGYMLRNVAADFYDPASVALFRKDYAVQMRYRGFTRAILSTVRQGMLGDFSSTYKALAALKLPLLLIWGQNDRTVPFEQNQRFRQLVPSADFLPVPDSGHIPHYERPDVVNPRLLGFLHTSHAKS